MLAEIQDGYRLAKDQTNYIAIRGDDRQIGGGIRIIFITKIGAGDVVLAANSIGLPGLIAARFPTILSVEANLFIVRTIPVSLTVIPLPDITTIAFLTVTTTAIAFPAITTTVVVFPTIVITIIFLTVALSTVAFLAIGPPPVACVLIDLVSREVVPVVVAVRI